MSRNYDNWDRLVEAVLRREKDRQLAYCESLSTCSSADLSSRFSFDSAVEDADFSFNFVGDVHLPPDIDEQMDESGPSNWDVGFHPFNDMMMSVVRREKDRQLAYCESFSTTSSTDLSSRFSFVGDVHVSAVRVSPLLLEEHIVGYKMQKTELMRRLVDGDKRLLRFAVDGPGGSGNSIHEQMDESRSSNWNVGFQPFNGTMPVSRSPLQKFDPSNPSSQSIFFFRNVMAIEYKEIKKATKNFKPELLLGEGEFGPVYKGWLHEHYLTPVKPGSGIAVAVKKLNKEGFQGHNEWMDEIHYLSQIRHPNMVKLIGYSFETDDDRNVVYEFMSNGSLDNHLFTSRHHSLVWGTRMKVAVGAARALAFLHALEIPVIHRNIKSGDILLDADFNPKLSDFGLAIDGPTGDMAHVETRVMGTYGYAAPEYLATGHLTTRCDVYGFGVVLLELITGLRAIDKERPMGQQKLMDWVIPQLRKKKRVLKIIDSRLDGQYPHKEAYKVAEIGLQCVSSDPKLRPRMNEVVAALEKL